MVGTYDTLIGTIESGNYAAIFRNYLSLEETSILLPYYLSSNRYIQGEIVR